MKLKFLGHSGAFATLEEGNTNALIEVNGNNLLIDFGIISNVVWKSEWKRKFTEIDAVYCSHVHGDHCCFETFLFSRYFLPKIENEHKVKPLLFAHPTVIAEIWDHLKPSMGVYRNEIFHLTNFAECHACSNFEFEGVNFSLIRNYHIKSSFASKDAYGLFFEVNGKKIYWSSDSVNINRKFINQADIVFHDCEFDKNRSGVHAHYSDLRKLPPEIKSKMYLMHYSTHPEPWKKDGFAGVVRKNDEFDF